MDKYQEDIENVKTIVGNFKYEISENNEDKHFINILNVGWTSLLGVLTEGEFLMFCTNKQSNEDRFKDSIYFKKGEDVGIMINSSNNTIKNILEKSESVLEEFNTLKNNVKLIQEESDNFFKRNTVKSDNTDFPTYSLTVENMKEKLAIDEKLRDAHSAVYLFHSENINVLTIAK